MNNMGIRIKEVKIRNCGPLKEFNVEFKDLNIIYGMNESGKSFIVEFLINALFKNEKSWGYLREDIGNGVVKLEIDGKVEEFKPKSKRKLDDYLIDKKGLPTLLSRLLVVKSGEVEVSTDCIDKKFVKDMLSQEKTLDNVEKNISKTIIDSEISDEGFNIKKTKEVRGLYDLKDEYNTIQEIINNKIQKYNISEYTEYTSKKEEIITKIEKMKEAKRYKAFLFYQEIKKFEEEISKYPDNKIYLLEELLSEAKEKKRDLQSKEEDLNINIHKTKEITELEKKKEEMLKAKGFLAYRHSQEISKRKKEIENIPEELINRIESQITDLNRNEDEIKKLKKTIAELENNTKEYEWLNAAKEIYLKFSEAYTRNYLNLILIGLSLIIFSIVFFLKNNFLVFISVLLGITGLIMTILKEIRKGKDFLKRREINIIKDEFKEKFGKELKGLTSIYSELENLNEDYNKIKICKDEKMRKEIELETLKGNIEKDVKFISKDDIPLEKVNEFITNLKIKRKELMDEIKNSENKISSLNVKETDYCSKDPGLEYNDGSFEELKEKLSILYEKKEEEKRLKEQINSIKNELSSLIQRIKNTFKGMEIIIEDEKDFEHSFNTLKKSLDEKNKRLIEVKTRLDSLSVNEKDYVREDPGITFSQEELEKLEEENKKISNELENMNKRLQELKSEIIKITGDEITTELDKLLENLFKKNEEIYVQLKNKEAEIIGKKLVSLAIQELRKEEDEKIIDSLNSKDINDSIFNLTKKYNKLLIEGDNIKISSDFDEFYLKDLSTGAKEQVMLGIRIGFIKKILGKDKIFLVLDDAFQHSDYEKRPILIDTLIRLSEEGWQMIYLTMDDNIKEEFTKQINLKKINNYRFIKI